MDTFTYTMEKKIPFAVQFNLTRRCNLRCIHCCESDRRNSQGNGSHHFSQELSFPEIAGILEQLAQAGCLVLTFSGGEVLLREDLIPLINLARSLNFAVKIFTNGTLLGEKIIESFARLHVLEVHVSLYAQDPGIHEAICDVPGSWKMTMEGIRLLREARIPVKIKCPIMVQNLPEYHKVYDLAVDLGVGYAFDPIITARNNGNRDPLQYRIPHEDLRKVLNDSIFKSNEESEGEGNPSCLGNIMPEEAPCSAGHNICFISAEGDVFPCVQLPIACGNLRNQTFEAIWHHSPKMLLIRQLRLNDLQKCRDCQHLTHCARCPGLALLEDGDLLGPSSAACWMVKAHLGGEK